jgi:hypothetical protein
MGAGAATTTASVIGRLRCEYANRPPKHFYGKYWFEPFPLINRCRAIT